MKKQKMGKLINSVLNDYTISFLSLKDMFFYDKTVPLNVGFANALSLENNCFPIPPTIIYYVIIIKILKENFTKGSEKNGKRISQAI